VVSNLAGLCGILDPQPGSQWLGIISAARVSDAALNERNRGEIIFGPLTVPFGAVMLFNVVKLNEGVTQSDVELAMGEMCNVVKNTYGDDDGGVIGGQVLQIHRLRLRGRLIRFGKPDRRPYCDRDLLEVFRAA